MDLTKIFHYDPTTGIIRWINSKRAHFNGKESGYINNKGYRMVEYDNQVYSAHRLAWFLYYGNFPSKEIDHINGIKTDNRITNLREVSTRENCQNRRRNINGKLPGAFYSKKDNRWYAQIKINGKSTHLGIFSTESEASNHYFTMLKQFQRNGIIKFS
jgi:hypothetical protein